jgi:hypothetical protein
MTHEVLQITSHSSHIYISLHFYLPGCWDIDEHDILGRVAPAANNYVTIHFDKDTSDGTARNTVSTGMENGSEYNSYCAALKCLIVLADSFCLSLLLRWNSMSLPGLQHKEAYQKGETLSSFLFWYFKNCNAN